MNRRPIHIGKQEVPWIIPAGWRVVDILEDGYLMQNAFIGVIVSFATERDGRAWKHISVSRHDGRIPAWIDLYDVRQMVVKPNETAYMIWPSRDEYVDMAPQVKKEVLHLFVPLNHRPLPDFHPTTKEEVYG